ncbi:MAG: hypothetical protein AAFY88_32510 [Acidobacteriota bacterium]
MATFLERWSRIDEALDAALELTADRRGELLEQIGGRDPELRRQLERLLRRADQGQSALDRGAAALVDPASESGMGPGPEVASKASPWLGRRIGRYRLEREIGAGGMATVSWRRGPMGSLISTWR